MRFAPRPGTVRAGMDTNAATDAAINVTDRTEFFHVKGLYGKLLALTDTHTARHAPRRIELRFCHADDAKVMHTYFATVIRAPCKSHFDV